MVIAYYQAVVTQYMIGRVKVTVDTHTQGPEVIVERHSLLYGFNHNIINVVILSFDPLTCPDDKANSGDSFAKTLSAAQSS